MEATNAVVPKRNWKKLLNVGAITAAGTAMATSAFAVEEVADLMAVANITGAKTAVFAMLSSFILIGVLFKGRALLAKLGVSV